ncbi:MAG: aminopeptidase, partial [Pseudomonadota bacterium]|nr:aminopeptidase [Pseudomonadota bacterium]
MGMPNIRLLVCLSPLFLAGCSHVAYLAQAARGQGELLARRQPIECLLDEVGTGQELRRQLERVQRIRRFASAELGLPDNTSYLSYADLQRPYAVWNVVAAPEFSVTARRWCFPIAGCVAYRGYFNKQAAQRFAGRLREEGDDVFVGGVKAYSTLGWFDDPVLNTFIYEPPEKLAALIFHELAHQ